MPVIPRVRKFIGSVTDRDDSHGSKRLKHSEAVESENSLSRQIVSEDHDNGASVSRSQSNFANVVVVPPDITETAPQLLPMPRASQISKEPVLDILSTTDVRERRKVYWELAYATLPEKHKAILGNSKIDQETLHQQFNELKRKTTMEPAFGEPNPIMRRAKLHSFLRKVERYWKVVDIAIQHQPYITALVWAGIRFALALCLNDFRTFDAISNAVDQIPTILCSCEKHDEIFFPLKAKDVLYSIPPIYTACLKFTAEALIYVGERVLKRVFKGPVEVVLKPHIDKIIEQKALLEKHATESHQSITLLGATSILKHLDAIKRREILDALSVVKPDDHHYHARRNRIASSGKWLFHKTNFINWMEDNQSSVFWLYGQAGSGKTVLTSALVDSLRATYPQCPILYFYCNYKEDLRRRQESIVRTLYRNLAAFGSSSDKLQEALVREYDAWESKGRLSSYLGFDNVKELFLTEASKYDLVFIIVDALDECYEEHRLELVEYLAEKFLTSSEAIEDSHVKIFLTSRHDNGISQLLEGRPKYEINVEDTSKDIRSFVEERLTSMTKKGQLFSKNPSQEMRREIVDTLCEKAGGM